MMSKKVKKMFCGLMAALWQLYVSQELLFR